MRSRVPFTQERCAPERKSKPNAEPPKHHRIDALHGAVRLKQIGLARPGGRHGRRRRDGRLSNTMAVTPDIRRASRPARQDAGDIVMRLAKRHASLHDHFPAIAGVPACLDFRAYRI